MVTERPVRPLRVVFCWAEVSGYAAACWQSLARVPGVDLHVVHPERLLNRPNPFDVAPLMAGVSNEMFDTAAPQNVFAYALWLQCAPQCVEQLLRFFRVVGAEITHIDVDRNKPGFGPGMDREMRFRQQHSAGDPLRRELVEVFADRGQPGSRGGGEAKRAQRVRTRHCLRVGRTAEPFAQQVNSVH